MLNHQFDRLALGLATLSFLTGCQSPATVAAPQAPAPAAEQATANRHVMGFGGFGGPTFNPLVLPQPESGPAVFDPVQNTTLQLPALAGTGGFGGFPSAGPPPGPGLINTNPGDVWYAPGLLRGLPFPVQSGVVSPNGHWALFSAGGVCYLYDVTAGNRYTVPFIHPTFFDLRVFDVSPDLHYLLYASDGVLRQLDLRTGWTINFSLVPGFFDDAHFGPNGTVVFLRNGRLQSYNADTGLLDTMPIANRGLFGF